MGKNLAKAGFKEIKATKNFKEEVIVAAKQKINAWGTRVKKPGVDGDQVISDFKKYACE